MKLKYLNKALILRQITLIFLIMLLVLSCTKDEVAKDQVTFFKSFGIGTKSEGVDLMQLKDDTYLIYGTCTTDSFGTDLFITKADKYGNEIWKSNFGSKKDETAFCMHSLTNGGYLLLGTVNVSGSASENVTNIYLAKTNAEGNNLIWEKRFYSPYSAVGYDLQELSTGGYVIAGTLKNTDATYSILYFTDSEGTVVDSVYQDFQDIEAKKIININDTFEIFGTQNSGIYGVQGASDMYAFIKTSSSLNSASFSSCRIGEAEADKGVDIRLLADRSFVFLGNEGDKNIRLVKFRMINENFIHLWKEESRKILGSADSTYQPTCIEVISEKEYAISGTVNKKEIFVLKTDSSGNQTYKHVFKSSGTKKCSKIIKTNDGNIAILGTNEYSDYKVIMLLKVDVNGGL